MLFDLLKRMRNKKSFSFNRVNSFRLILSLCKHIAKASIDQRVQSARIRKKKGENNKWYFSHIDEDVNGDRNPFLIFQSRFTQYIEMTLLCKCVHMPIEIWLNGIKIFSHPMVFPLHIIEFWSPFFSLNFYFLEWFESLNWCDWDKVHESAK